MPSSPSQMCPTIPADSSAPENSPWQIFLFFDDIHKLLTCQQFNMKLGLHIVF